MSQFSVKLHLTNVIVDFIAELIAKMKKHEEKESSEEEEGELKEDAGD